MRRSAPQQPTRITNGQQHSEDSRRYWEEKRLMFLLGSTSILFSVCITPQLVLSLMIHEAVLQSYYFQVMECFFFSSTPSLSRLVRILCSNYFWNQCVGETFNNMAWLYFIGGSGVPCGGQHSRGDKLLVHILHILPLLPRFSSHIASNIAHLFALKWANSDMLVTCLALTITNPRVPV